MIKIKKIPMKKIEFLIKNKVDFSKFEKKKKKRML